MRFTIFCCLVLIVAVSAASIPSWINVCNRDDPKLNECFIENAHKALQEMVKGDASLQIPNFFPLKHPGFAYDPNDEFHLILTHFDVIGTETLSITKAKINLDEKHIYLEFFYPKVEWLGEYEASALKENDEVKGKVHIVFVSSFKMNLNFDVKDNKLQVLSTKVDFDKKDITYDFEGLDAHPKIKALWEKHENGFSEASNGAISQFITLMFTNIWNTGTYDDFFPSSKA